MRLLPALILFLMPWGTASILPAEPPEGLRITVSISCDFQQRWWEATLYPHPGTGLPLEVRWRAPGMRGHQPRDLVRSLNPDQRQILYDLSRAAFDDFQLDRRPPLLGDPDAGPWLGSRTLSLSALILDHALGRVDRIDLALDMLPGRALPEEARQLVDALSRLATPIDTNLDCR
ncbi:MAG: hypothetical protein JJT88_14570 [Gammaproteobacteria bacterium]|nr:hypothetical protein [Gammaproteobacteria bacterium]